MSKKVKYDKLLNEVVEVANPKRNVKNFWKWLTKDVGTLSIKPSASTKNINYQISELLINPYQRIDQTLDNKRIKILCNIFDIPYNEDKKKSIENIQKFIINNPSKIRNVFIKHMDSMSYDDMSCFHMDHKWLCDEMIPPYFYWNPKTKKGDKYYKFENSDGLPADYNTTDEIPEEKLYDKSKPINPDMAKIHMNRDLLDMFNIKIKEIDDFEKEKVNEGWEFNKIFEKFLSLYTGLLSSDNISKEIDDLTKNIFADTNNVYKFNVDKNYNLDKSGLGGPYHRLHDESHSLHEMAKKVKDAVPDDSNITEIIAFINEFAKDVQTTMGIPVVSIKKETFDSMHSFLKPLGVNKNDLYDFLTYNLQEVLNVCFIIAYYLFPSTRKNKEKLGNVYGLLTICGAFGNPLALVVLALTLITSVIKNDFKNEKDRKELLKGAAKSAGLTLLIKFALGFFDIDSIGKLIGFFVGIAVVVILYKKGIKKVEINKFKKEVEKEIEKLSKKSKFILEQTKLIEMK